MGGEYDKNLAEYLKATGDLDDDAEQLEVVAVASNDPELVKPEPQPKPTDLESVRETVQELRVSMSEDAGQGAATQGNEDNTAIDETDHSPEKMTVEQFIAEVGALAERVNGAIGYHNEIKNNTIRQEHIHSLRLNPETQKIRDTLSRLRTSFNTLQTQFNESKKQFYLETFDFVDQFLAEVDAGSFSAEMLGKDAADVDTDLAVIQEVEREEIDDAQGLVVTPEEPNPADDSLREADETGNVVSAVPAESGVKAKEASELD
ncbi:MAG: hypothetical protein WAU07_00275, partial [Microgenomates group bacterium]